MKAARPLRHLTQEEERALQRIVKASSERADVVKRAKAILAVRAGKSYSAAAQEAGYKSGDSVSQLVERFNQRGLAALLIGPGRGRKETYSLEQRQRIMQELERSPDREEDQTATWSLMTLRNALRKQALQQAALPDAEAARRSRKLLAPLAGHIQLRVAAVLVRAHGFPYCRDRPSL